MTAQDYEVTFSYGATSPPYGTANNPYHRGEDRFTPVGTPVVVNRVTIGLTGATGWVTGPHLHIGRYIGGKDTNPNGGGFNLKSPLQVTTVAQDNTNGKYVRLTDADGVQWVYLHLSRQDVVAGQVLSNKELTMTPEVAAEFAKLVAQVEDIKQHQLLTEQSIFGGDSEAAKTPLTLRIADTKQTVIDLDKK